MTDGIRIFGFDHLQTTIQLLDGAEPEPGVEPEPGAEPEPKLRLGITEDRMAQALNEYHKLYKLILYEYGYRSKSLYSVYCIYYLYTFKLRSNET